MQYAEYGSGDQHVIVVHGGPAARGSVEHLARPLGDAFCVFEPYQRRSDDQPLTVARHVADLHAFIHEYCCETRPVVIGHSWGAMLALAHAAAHPNDVRAIGLVGCGTFDQSARNEFERLRDERTEGGDYKAAQRQLEIDYPDLQDRMDAWDELLSPIYDYEPLPKQPRTLNEPFDLRGHTETWNDMLRCQTEGDYPASFINFQGRGRVAMFHGNDDPHPGRMIRDGLLPILPQLTYHEFKRCGHEPWLEKHAHDAFFRSLHDWLAQQFTTTD